MIGLFSTRYFLVNSSDETPTGKHVIKKVGTQQTELGTKAHHSDSQLTYRKRDLYAKIADLRASKPHGGLEIDAISNGLDFESTRHPTLKLTRDEIIFMRNAIVDIELASGELKAAVAHVVRSEDGKIEVTVPARPMDAQILSDMLYEQISQNISTERTAQIKQEMEPFLVSMAYGFGSCDETYTFNPNTSGSLADYQFKFSADISNDSIKTPGYEVLASYGDAGKRIGHTDIQSIEQIPQFAFLAKVLKPK